MHTKRLLALDSLMVLGIALLPVYIWSSGGVQIAHLVLFLVGVAVIVFRGYRPDLFSKLFFLLAVYLGLREGFYIVTNSEPAALLPVLHVSYSVLLYASVVRWAERDSAWGFAGIGFGLAALVAVASVFLIGYGAAVDSESQARSVGSFNNPNQLGYFAVCLLSIAALLYFRKTIGVLYFSVLAFAAVFLSIASLSKAAMVSCAFAVILLGFVLFRSRAKFLGGLSFGVVVLLVLIFLIERGAFDEYRFFVRLASIGADSDDSLSGRGYDILLDVGALELIFGYGSHSVREIVGHELHSTVGSFFANYGLLGGGLFAALMILWSWEVVRAFGFVGVMILVVPSMLYGLTHNGSRFTIFWLLIALSVSACRSRGKEHILAPANRAECFSMAELGEGRVGRDALALVHSGRTNVPIRKDVK